METTTTTGKLIVSIYQEGDLSPIPGAQVEISDMNGNIIRRLQTDEFGNIKTITLPALSNHTRSENANGTQSTQGKYIITVKHPNFEPVRVEGIQIFEGSKAIPEIHLSSSRGEEMAAIKTIKIDDSKSSGVKHPENPFNISELLVNPESFYNTYKFASGYEPSVDPTSFYSAYEFATESETSPNPQIGLVIPETLTVQLFKKDRRGRIIGPGRKVVLPFVDYIKGVIHKEILGFTEDEAIRANVIAAVSFTLNRYYTEHYRRQNLDYHVTNDTGKDHDYDENHPVNAQEPLVRNIEEFFSKYIQYPGNHFFPFLAQYCSGTNAKCAYKKWLEQTPSREMAKRGKTHSEIIKKYYGSNFETTSATQIVINKELYSFISPMKLGDSGDTVLMNQHYLDVIGKKLENAVLSGAIEENGKFGEKTDKAVRLFQEHLMRMSSEKVNGVIDQKTWYVILTSYLKYVNNGNERNIKLTSSPAHIPSASRPIGKTNLQQSNPPIVFWPDPQYGLVCKMFHTSYGPRQYCYYTYYWEVYHTYYQ